MSAGEFFDLLRPAFLVCSTLISTFILADALRRGSLFWTALAWATATLFLAPVVVPLYLLVRIYTQRRSPLFPLRMRVLLLVIYVATILTIIAGIQHRNYNTVDSHVARAHQAKLIGDRQRTISEYRAALAIGNDPHTRKLLGLELIEVGAWSSALSELRAAESAGEPDPTLPFRIAMLLDGLNDPQQAAIEYKRFLASSACSTVPADSRCETAKMRLSDGSKF